MFFQKSYTFAYIIILYIYELYTIFSEQMNIPKILFILFFFGCNSNQNIEEVQDEKSQNEQMKTFDSSIIYTDSSKYFIEEQNKDWQNRFNLKHDITIDSIWYKPVKYYFDDQNCDTVAKDFYWGKYRPTDEEKTAKLLAKVTTNNNKLRPLYRWVLNKTIYIQDGALAEYTGEPARRYAEKYPKEFFEYMDIDTTGEKYNEWSGSIMYSGFYNEDNWRRPDLIRQTLIKTMTQNCKGCNDDIKKRISKLAFDCFPNVDSTEKR